MQADSNNFTYCNPGWFLWNIPTNYFLGWDGYMYNVGNQQFVNNIGYVCKRYQSYSPAYPSTGSFSIAACSSTCSSPWSQYGVIY